MSKNKKPTRYDEVIDQINHFVHNIHEDEKLENPPAFVRIRDALLGEVYEIYVSTKFGKHTSDYLLMHECGHVIFNHVEGLEDQLLAVSGRIRARFEEYKDRFQGIDEFYSYFRNYLLNVVEDFEVNSKLFSSDELDEMEKLIGGRPCRPEDYGYPLGKTWREYVGYILDDMEKFLDKTKDMLSDGQPQQQNGQGNGQGQGSGSGKNGGGSGKGQGGSGNGKNGKKKSGQGNSSGSNGDEDENGKNGNGGKGKGNGGKDSDKDADSSGGFEDGSHTFTLNELKKMRKAVADRSPAALKQLADEVAEREAEAASGGRSASGHEVNGMRADGSTSFDSLHELIKKHVFTRTIAECHRDQMYNVNRRKLGGSTILVPRSVKRQTVIDDDFFILLDVSGSVDTQIVKNTVAMFSKFAKDFGRKSRLIMWDTSCCFDEELRKIKNTAVNGGGTDLAPGIEYIEKNYIKGKAKKLFIVSDFCDDLNAWQRTLKSHTNIEAYGINWDKSAYEQTKKTDLPKYFKSIWHVDPNSGKED